MIKWEYFFYSIKNSEFNHPKTLESSALRAIPAIGDQGWELVSVAVYQFNTIMIFKRPKEESNR